MLCNISSTLKICQDLPAVLATSLYYGHFYDDNLYSNVVLIVGIALM